MSDINHLGPRYPPNRLSRVKRGPAAGFEEPARSRRGSKAKALKRIG